MDKYDFTVKLGVASSACDTLPKLKCVKCGITNIPETLANFMATQNAPIQFNCSAREYHCYIQVAIG